MRTVLIAFALLFAALAGCLPVGTAGTLAPTLTVVDTDWPAVALQTATPFRASTGSPDRAWNSTDPGASSAPSSISA